MKIRAIYINDMKFSEMPIFELDESDNKFKMIYVDEDGNKTYLKYEYDKEVVEGDDNFIIAKIENEEAFKFLKTKKMNFGQALEYMKNGQKVCRKGWNGKNMFIVVMPELNLPPYNTQDINRKVNDRTAKWIGEDTPLESQPYIAMFTAQKKWQPGWLPSQADLFANDWEVAQ